MYRGLHSVSSDLISLKPPIFHNQEYQSSHLAHLAFVEVRFVEEKSQKASNPYRARGL